MIIRFLLYLNLQQKMKMKQLYLCVILLAIHLIINAQQPSWTASLGNLGMDEINFIRKTGGNTVLISTQNKIFGVSAKDKKVVWESKNFSNLADTSVKVHNGTPYVTIYGTSTFGLRKEYTMLNAETGQVVFSNKTEDGNVTGEVFLNRKKAFLIFAKKGSGAYVSYRSLESGTELWRKEFSANESKSTGLVGALLKMSGEFLLRSEANNDNAENIILFTINTIFCLNATSGNTLWSIDYKKPIVNAVRSDDEKYLFVQHSNILFNYIDMVTGKEVLPSNLKLKNSLINVTKDAKGYLLLTERGVNVLQNDGTFLYNKNIGKNIVTNKVWTLNDGYLMANNGARGIVDIVKVNKEGDKVWTKYLNGDTKIFTLQSGIFAINDAEADLYDYSEGKSLWDGKVKLRGETFFGYDYDSLSIAAYNKGKIEMFNLVTGTYKNIISGFEFKDRLANNDRVFLTLLKEGIFINTNQNYALVGYDGTIKYNKSMPDASGFTKRFKNRLALASTIVGLVGVVKMASAEYAYQTGIYNGTITQTQAQQLANLKKNGETIANVGSAGVAIADFLNTFDKQSALSQKTVTILTNDGSGISAVVIDKATGNEKKRVKVNDTKPTLYVDDVTNTLYVVTTLLDLKVYDLN
jgi:hypothetical protein